MLRSVENAISLRSTSGKPRRNRFPPSCNSAEQAGATPHVRLTPSPSASWRGRINFALNKGSMQTCLHNAERSKIQRSKNLLLYLFFNKVCSNIGFQNVVSPIQGIFIIDNYFISLIPMPKRHFPFSQTMTKLFWFLKTIRHKPLHLIELHDGLIQCPQQHNKHLIFQKDIF